MYLTESEHKHYSAEVFVDLLMRYNELLQTGVTTLCSYFHSKFLLGPVPHFLNPVFRLHLHFWSMTVPMAPPPMLRVIKKQRENRKQIQTIKRPCKVTMVTDDE